MLTLELMTNALHTYWADHPLTGTLTNYPGTLLNLADQEDWYEIWIDQFQGLPNRGHALLELSLSVSIHCFSRSSVQTTRAQNLADHAITVLQDACIPVRDTEGPDVGMLRLKEPAIRNLSRVHAALERIQLQHLVLNFPANATACL